MRFTTEQLRQKALLALEEVVQECRYHRPRRSFAIRFAIAFLWAHSSAERREFDELWRVLGCEKSPWSFSAASNALVGVYRALNLERDEEIAIRFWRRWRVEENKGPDQAE